MIWKLVDGQMNVLVPFYRGAVVFYSYGSYVAYIEKFSSPFIEERLYLRTILSIHVCHAGFSSPFIEERLYLVTLLNSSLKTILFSSPFIEERLYFLVLSDDVETTQVLVPFYRGAVVFFSTLKQAKGLVLCSSPLLSRSGCIWKRLQYGATHHRSSRPLLSRSGCIW